MQKTTRNDLKQKVEEMWEQEEYLSAFRLVQDYVPQEKSHSILTKSHLESYEHVIAKLLKRLRKQVNALNEHNDQVGSADQTVRHIDHVHFEYQVRDLPLFNVANGHLEAEMIDQEDLFGIIDQI